MMKYLLIVLIAASLQACAPIEKREIHTNATVFHGEGHEVRGTIIALPIDKTQEDSLQFKTLSNYVLGQLSRYGYAPANSVSDSQYLVFMTYGINNGQTERTSVPIFGQTGGGTTYTSGVVHGTNGLATYSGTSRTMPTYGVVGAVPVDTTTFKREVNIDIYKKNGKDKSVKVYEMRAISSGSCGDINAVIYKIIDSMFTSFPGVNGQSNLVKLPWEGNC